MLKNLLTQLETQAGITEKNQLKNFIYFHHHSTLPQPDNPEYRPLFRQLVMQFACAALFSSSFHTTTARQP